METRSTNSNIRTLMNKARKGDSEAFSFIQDVYFTPVFQYVSFHVKKEDVASDLIQTIFLKFIRSIGNFEEKGKEPLSYFFSIARNTVSDYQKMRNKSPIENNQIGPSYASNDLKTEIPVTRKNNITKEINREGWKIDMKKTQIKPPPDLLKNILFKSDQKNKTEGVRKPSKASNGRSMGDRKIDSNLKVNNDPIKKVRVSIYLFSLNVIRSNMNKKIIIGIGIVLMSVISGAVILQTEKKSKPIMPIEDKFAIEKDINNEKKSFDQDVNDLNELEKDAIMDNINSDLSEINDEIASYLPPAIADLDIMEKELAYELDSFDSDLNNSDGIENDTSLASLSAQIGSISN